jgi:zinc protease
MKHTTLRVLAALAVTMLLLTFAHAQNDIPVPVDPLVKIGKLSNGLTYYIRKNAEPKNRSELYLVIKAGSNMENDDQQGLAHFSEHMAFNGTKDFPKNQLVDYLQKSGVRFGADLNAYTAFDETVYQLPLPTDEPELFAKGFTILSNWAAHVAFETEEIEKERGIIIEEDRLRGKDAGERMRSQIFPLIFKNSRYADRLPIGKMDIIGSFKRETIRQFYHDWYRPNLQAVIAVGDFDVAAVEALIKKNFSKLKNPAKERKRETFTIPMNDKPLAKVVTDPEFSYTVAYMLFKQLVKKTGTTKDLRASAMTDMINRMFSARIQEILEKGNAPFVHASGGYGPYYGGLGNLNAFSATAVAREPEDLQKAVEGIIAEVKRVHQFGFTPTELARTKKSFLADVEKQYNERHKTASSHFVNEYVGHFTKGQSIPGVEFLFPYYTGEMERITTEDVNALAKTITTLSGCVAIIEALEANRSRLPDEPTYLSWIDGAGSNLTPYVDQALDQPLMPTQPQAGRIVSERKIDSEGVTELKLSNGITVVMKPTDYKQDEIIFSSSSTGGTSLVAEKDYLSASIAADVVSASGVGAYDKSQLTRLLSGKVLGVTPYIDQHYEGIYGHATPRDLATAFQLIHLYLAQPRVDSNVFHMLKSNYAVNLAARPSFPGAVYQDTISAVMSGYTRRYMTPSLKDVEKLDLQTVYRIYKDRFADNHDLTFFFVGNFSVDELKPYLELYLASLPAAGRKESYVDLKIRPMEGKVDKKVFKGLEDKASVSLILHDAYAYNETNNLMLEVLASTLRIELVERLREKESGVYSPSVKLEYSKVPYETYTIHISFSCSGGNVEKLINATLEEIGRLRSSGVSQVDLEKFQAEERRQVEIRKRDNGFWMYYLSDTYTRGEDIDRILNYTNRLGAIKLEETKAAAQRFLNDVNFKRIVLLPENMKSANHH